MIVEDTVRLRLRQCMDTIVEVHDFLEGEQVHDSLLGQFDRLRRVLSSLEMESVTPAEVERVEQATNRLLNELKVLFEYRDLGNITDHQLQ